MYNRLKYLVCLSFAASCSLAATGASFGAQAVAVFAEKELFIENISQADGARACLPRGMGGGDVLGFIAELKEYSSPSEGIGWMRDRRCDVLVVKSAYADDTQAKLGDDYLKLAPAPEGGSFKERLAENAARKAAIVHPTNGYWSLAHWNLGTGHAIGFGKLPEAARKDAVAKCVEKNRPKQPLSSYKFKCNAGHAFEMDKNYCVAVIESQRPTQHVVPIKAFNTDYDSDSPRGDAMQTAQELCIAYYNGEKAHCQPGFFGNVLKYSYCTSDFQ